MTVRRWPLFLIAAPAAVAVWSGWVGLGGLCGFGIIHPLPGIWGSLKLNTAITLPIGVEAYGSYAMAAWLATAGVAARAKKFARNSSIGSLVLGMTGQVAYHLLNAWHATHAPWPIVVMVSALPVVTLGFGVGLAHLLSESAPIPETIASTISASDMTPDPAHPNWNINHYRARAQLRINPNLKGREFGPMIQVSERHANRILKQVREAA